MFYIYSLHLGSAANVFLDLFLVDVLELIFVCERAALFFCPYNELEIQN